MRSGGNGAASCVFRHNEIQAPLRNLLFLSNSTRDGAIPAARREWKRGFRVLKTPGRKRASFGRRNLPLKGFRVPINLNRRLDGLLFASVGRPCLAGCFQHPAPINSVFSAFRKGNFDLRERKNNVLFSFRDIRGAFRDGILSSANVRQRLANVRQRLANVRQRLADVIFSLAKLPGGFRVLKTPGKK